MGRPLFRVHMYRNSLQDKYSLRVCCLPSHRMSWGESADIRFATICRNNRNYILLFNTTLEWLMIFVSCVAVQDLLLRNHGFLLWQGVCKYSLRVCCLPFHRISWIKSADVIFAIICSQQEELHLFVFNTHFQWLMFFPCPALQGLFVWNHRFCYGEVFVAFVHGASHGIS